MNDTGNKTEGAGKKSGDGMDALLSVPANTVESLRAHVNRLHAERGVAVLDAKKSREEQGFKSMAFQLDWAYVEDLTRSIVHYEADLEKALTELETEKMWRDAAVELPDDDITVMLRMLSDGDEPLAIGFHNDGAWWICGVDVQALGLDVIGWMHLHEAAEILDAARKEVTHG